MFAAGKTNAVSGETFDAQFNYVTMLLHGDGTNGAQNNTFLDSSTNNFTITRNGNTTQGSFSPYGSNWSNYFDGNGDYLTAANNTALDVGTGAFTIEGWIYQDGTGDADWRLVAGNTSSAGFFGGRGTLSLGFGRSAVAWDLESASNVYSLNTWTHVVYVRNGSGNLAIFANGTRVATTTNSNNYGLNGGLLEVGAEGANQYFGGYISNVRVVKGSAVYDPTVSTLTVPTTPLAAVSGTGLLTCQSNRFKDNSTNNFTLTVNGNTSVQRFNPFGASAAYSTSVIGGSGYFDGSGDYLSVANNSAFDILSGGNFTVECFVYFTSLTNNGGYGSAVITKGSFSGGWILRVTPTDLGLVYPGVSANYISKTFTSGQWYHIVAQRESTTMYYYVNGERFTPSYTDKTTDLSTALTIGNCQADTNTANVTGYIGAARIVKGTAVYSGTTITVPTSPLTAVSGTSLLTNMTNGAIYDNAMMNDLETVGNAQISTSVVKYGTGSLAFDGTGDYLVSPTTTQFNPRQPFTVEFWTYPNSTTTIAWINGNSSLFYIETFSGTLYVGDGSTNIISTTPPSTSAWTHVALSFDGTTYRLFYNGTSQATSTSLLASNVLTAWYIGAKSDGSRPFNGYIDDLRITKGYARYTANFTAPTAAFPNIGPV